MTLKEAEEFFKRYDGHHFHMGREEPSAYKEFSDMNISNESEEQWRQELVDDYIERLRNGDVVPMTSYGLINTASSLVSTIFGIIVMSKNNKYNNISLLLDAILAIAVPDKREKIYIMERITEYCGMIMKYGLDEKMNRVFKKVADFLITEEDKEVDTGYRVIPERYESAVRKYRETYEHYRMCYADKSQN